MKYQYIVDLLMNSKGFSTNAQASIKQITQMEGAANRVRTSLTQVAGAMGLAFGVAEIAKFAKESVDLAAKAEGVRAAFEKLNRPDLLNQLRTATRGAVDDLALMTAAVQSRNFKISLEALPKYLAFASQRALETGQSVDYMVESLITGVGRKSVLWLDNLGLSVSEINEELKKTPNFAVAVGNVIEREMKKAGDVTSTAATQFQKLNASWQNFKEEVGKKIIDIGVADQVEAWAEVMRINADETLSKEEKKVLRMKVLTEDVNAYTNALKEADNFFATLDEANVDRYIESYEKRTDAQGKWLLSLAKARKASLSSQGSATDGNEKEIRTLETLKQELQFYNDLLQKIPLSNRKEIVSTYEKINALEKEKEAFEDLAKYGTVERGIKPIDTKGAGPVMSSKPTLDLSKKGLGGDLGNIEEVLSHTKDLMNQNTEAWQKFAAEVNNKGNAMMTTGENLGSIFSSIASITDGDTEAWLMFASKTLESIPKLIVQIAALSTALGGKAIAGAVAGANDVPYPYNLIAMGTSVAATIAALATSIPKMADGGLASGPTLAMVGEYAGAKGNPEIIAPLSKLKDMIQPAMTEGSVIFHIGERELTGILERGQRIQKSRG